MVSPFLHGNSQQFLVLIVKADLCLFISLNIDTFGQAPFCCIYTSERVPPVCFVTSILLPFAAAAFQTSSGHSDEAARLSESRHHSALYDATLTGLIFIDLVSSLPDDRRMAVLRDADILAPRQGTLL